ncbi:MAG: hypothetical protein OES32_19915, partial [Acidobacteriota bacterium]|nr:hypothetical protein [Acidobacteriota bacterium]
MRLPSRRTTMSLLGFGLLTALAGIALPGQELGTVAEQRTSILELLRDEHGLSAEQLAAVEAIFEESAVLSQGNREV